MQKLNQFIRATSAVLAAVGFSLTGASYVSAEEVHLFRGFAGIYSKGVTKVTNNLRRKGINANVYPHAEWRRVADDIVLRKRKGKLKHPIILGGHSLGGIAAVRLANTLGAKGIPVKLVVSIDPGFKEPPRLRKGTRRAINYFLVEDGNRLKRGNGFSGRIANLDMTKLGVDHFSIDDNPKVQRQIIAQIRRATFR